MTAGTYYWIATYHSTADPQATDISTTCKEAGETSVVAPPGTPLLETDSTNGNIEGNIHVVGSNIHDTATLSGIGNNTYTGELTFKLYDNDSCDESGSPGHLVTTVKKAVASGDGSYDSPDFMIENAGSYWWVASFKSTTPSVTDAGPTQCNDPKEMVSITKAEPAITTTASDGEITVGDPVPNDTAHLSGLVNPKGTRSINFSFYDNANCDGTPVAQDTVAVTANGDYPTNIPNTTLTDHAGTYYWFASYSGDENNSPAETGCSDETEKVVVEKAKPSIETKASGPVTVGSDIHDTATIKGLIDPTKTATINFKLYGPDDPTCTHEPLNGTSGQDVTVDKGNGNYESPDFTTHQAGSYHWVAHYSGDENNEKADSACGDTGETSVIEKAKPSIETKASGPVTVGSNIHDTATIKGLIDPTKTATINFKLYGPDDPTCTHEPLNGTSGQDVTVDKGNGNYESPAFTTHQAGSYHWVAHYSGDENNEKADSACGDTGETSVIEKAKPSIETKASRPGHGRLRHPRHGDDQRPDRPDQNGDDQLQALRPRRPHLHTRTAERHQRPGRHGRQRQRQLRIARLHHPPGRLLPLGRPLLRRRKQRESRQRLRGHRRDLGDRKSQTVDRNQSLAARSRSAPTSTTRRRSKA